VLKNIHEIIGEACRIVAKKPSGPRGKEKIDCQIDSIDNLILLCPNHHTLIDKNRQEFTTEKLKEMKQLHEEKIYNKIHNGDCWDVNFSQLYYINLPRIAILAAYNGIELKY